MKNLKLIILFSSISLSSFAQFGLSPAQRDSINKRNNDDYNNMVKQIGIDPSRIRPGVSGNTKDANVAKAKKEAAEEKREANYKAAKERCDALDGDVKSKCVDDAKRMYAQ